MKNKNIFIFMSVFFIALLFSCSKKLDINEDPNAPSDVTEKLLLPGILSNFSYEVVGGWPVRTSSLLTKHAAYTAADLHEGKYYITASSTENFWKFYSYIDVMKNCKVLIDKAATNENPGYSAIAKIILAWNMSYITDSFGDAPFSEAFKGEEKNVKPKYDSQEDIYKQIQTLLDEAIVEAGQDNVSADPGSEDFVYGGDMEAWQHLARTLKARFYLRLSYAPGYSAATQADLALKALNEGAISANEMPTFAYYDTPDAQNPWYQYAILGNWNLYTRPSQFYVNLLSETNDPRLAYQVDKVPSGDNAGKYVGVTNDPTPTPLENYSALGSFYSKADAPLYWLVYAEVPFIRAEAEFLKANKTVTAAVTSAYEEGIEASMDMYGITNYQAYLTANALKTNANDAYKQIMTQKYIANYLQFESYNDFRRTGYPELTINDEAYPDTEDEPSKTIIPIIPLRFPYPASERSYNNDNIPTEIPAGYTAAMQIPVWWDSAE